MDDAKLEVSGHLRIFTVADGFKVEFIDDSGKQQVFGVDGWGEKHAIKGIIEKLK